MLIAEYSSGRQTKCAVCRSMTAHAEISYVTTRGQEEEEGGTGDGPTLEDIKGSHSTKVCRYFSFLLIFARTILEMVFQGVESSDPGTKKLNNMGLLALPEYKF